MNSINFSQEKKKRNSAEDVAEFNGNYKENIVTYLTADHDLYVINDAGKKIKLHRPLPHIH